MIPAVGYAAYLVQVERLANALDTMDHSQPVATGYPPCGHVQENGKLCGRAELWHDAPADAFPGAHEFISLGDAVRLLTHGYKKGDAK